jgi:hypothetical protein
MPGPKPLGLYSAEFLRPFTHSLVGKNYATRDYHFFNITVAQSKTEIQNNTLMTDDFRRKTVAGDIPILTGSCHDRIA